MGRDRLDKGELSAAKNAFEEALRASRDNPDALDGLVQVGNQGKQWNIMKNYGEKLARMLPGGSKQAQGLADVARAHLETNEWQPAEKFAHDALKEDPSLSGMDEIVALALAGSDKKTEALEALQKAFNAGTHDARIPLQISKILEAQNNVHDARVWLDKA